MRVECYYNLHRKTFSVRALEGPDKGRVVRHSDDVTLQNVSFIVQKAGREKVLREQRKNVHAFVRGDYVFPLPFVVPDECAVTYNPYRADHFQRKDNGARVDHAHTVVLGKRDGKATITAYQAA